MVTPSRVFAVLLLVLIVAIAAWSKLRFLDEDSFKPQRFRVEDFPAFQKQELISHYPASES
jgi:hypothetical protein